jgi:hypothetical protein
MQSKKLYQIPLLDKISSKLKKRKQPSTLAKIVSLVIFNKTRAIGTVP